MAYPNTKLLLQARKQQLTQEQLDNMLEYHYYESRTFNGERVQFTQDVYLSGRKATKKEKTKV